MSLYEENGMDFTVTGSESYKSFRSPMNVDCTGHRQMFSNVLSAQMSAWCVWVLATSLPCTLYCLSPSLLVSVSVLSG